MNIGYIELVGLLFDFLGGSLVIAAEIDWTRNRLARIYPPDLRTVIQGFEKARDEPLTRDDDCFWPVLEYLLQYPGRPNDGQLLRHKTRNWHEHLSRHLDAGDSLLSTPSVSAHPLYQGARIAEDARIEYSDHRGQHASTILVKVGDSRGEFSRWHDTQRIQSELYNRYVKLAFRLIVIGFCLQIGVYLGVFSYL